MDTFDEEAYILFPFVGDAEKGRGEIFSSDLGGEAEPNKKFCTHKLVYTESMPIYDIEKTYLQNFEEGPFHEGDVPLCPLPPEEEWGELFGFPIADPIGIPAGPLLNSNWVSYAGRLGFNVLTYKTIRSQEHPAHPLPNMVYLSAEAPLRRGDEGGILYQEERPPLEKGVLALTNSFGMPSFPPGYVVEDIARAKRSLRRGQLLIVSVVGTQREGIDFADDFAAAAKLAVAGGAEVIEANFSCPNVTGGEGSVYLDPKTVYLLTRRLKQEIGSIPLILKVGVFSDESVMRQVMLSAARGGAQGFCGINTVSMRVHKRDGTPALGPGRERAGVCGGPIFEAARCFIRLAHKINIAEKLGLTLLATGGITLPDQFDAFFEAGADVAMSAVGMMWDPKLAIKRRELC